MADEDTWAQERERFVADDAAARRDGDRRDGDRRDGDQRDGDRSLGSLVTELPQLAEAFATLTRSLLAPGGTADGDVATTLHRISEVGRRMVPGADVVSVTVRRDDEQGYTTPAETDPLATRLDEAQYRHHEGPCVTALERGGLGTAESPELATDTAFPHFGPAAAELGAASLFAVGLFPVGEPPLWGALNFYSFTAGGFAATDRDVALLLAAHSAIALGYVGVADALGRARSDLVRAREDIDITKASRDVIGQAKGILMERQGLSAGEAFDTLRRASQDLNIKLRDVAETLVENRGRI